MDKLITGIIIVAVVGFLYWLYQGGSDGMSVGSEMAAETAGVASEGPWVAVVGTGEEAHVAGHYNSYTECYQAVAGKVDVSVTPYSCTNQ